MKLYQIIPLLLSIFLMSQISYSKSKETIVKGKVINWPTDTVYLQTMPFHSPFSNELKYVTINADSTFCFKFDGLSKPMVIQVIPHFKSANINKEELLFLNCTERYYYGHCNKFYTYGSTTFLIEPGNELNVELKSNRKILKLLPKTAQKYRNLGIKVSPDNTFEKTGKTGIKFLSSDSFQDEYYQKSFSLDDKVDRRLELYESKPIEKAVISYNKILKKLLKKLDEDKDKLSPLFYDYIKAEIEFGARKEFIKFIMFSRKDSANKFFSNDISKEVMDIIEFDKSKVNFATLLNEEYNKYLELYVNFKMNIKNKSYSKYNTFSKQKCRMAIRNLPMETGYYYLSNNLLNELRTDDFIEDLIISMIKKFPNGELNDKLIEKYDL